MTSRYSKIISVALLALGVLFGGGEASQAEAKCHKKVGFFTRMKRAIKHKVKMTVKKTRRAIVKTGCAISNRIHDGATKAKSAITGKKPKRVWVKGHYKTHNKKHTKGHWRRVKRSHKHSGGCGTPSQAPAPISGGQPLPPLDPAMPQ